MKRVVCVTVEIEEGDNVHEKLVAGEYGILGEAPVRGRAPTIVGRVLQSLHIGKKRNANLENLYGKDLDEYLMTDKTYTTQEVVNMSAWFLLLQAVLTVRPERYSLVATDLQRHLERLEMNIAAREEQMQMRKKRITT